MMDKDLPVQQLEILGKSSRRVQKQCAHLHGCSRSAVYELDRVLIDVGLLRAGN